MYSSSTTYLTIHLVVTLLGLSPILNSLASSISKDSIWAIATWLFISNFLGFDYGSGIERKFPASFSTNAAITAAVVLASCLPTTTHVFSLMLFSIQVFGLFPVFRRYLKHISWSLHVCLTMLLVLGAAGGLSIMLGWGWAIVWVLSVVVGMGGCGWWMIDLQKYKKWAISFFRVSILINNNLVRSMDHGIQLAQLFDDNGNEQRIEFDM